MFQTTTNYLPVYLLLALTLASRVGVHSAHAQEQYLYWVGAIQPEETRGNTIFRYSLTSSVVDTLVQARVLSPDESRYFYYVTVDTLRGLIYWTDSGFRNSEGVFFIGAIMRASLDGDNLEVFLSPVACGIGGPNDIELDPVGETLYWSEVSDCPFVGLNSVSLESSNPTELQELPISRNYSVTAIEIDVPNNMIYWVNFDFPTLTVEPPGILRAPLDDTVSDEYIVTANVCDIALAHTLSKIYWTPCNSGVIRRSNLDGTDAEDVIVSQADVSNLAVDGRGGKIYWTEATSGKIRRANLDGTEVEDLLSGLVVPSSIALFFRGEIDTAVEPEDVFPEKVELLNIYPNPVRGSATIEFGLTESAHVTLEIYDLLGRRVEVLASRTYPPGQFRVEWNPTNQSNGVYFCKLATENGSKTIRLILQR